MQQYYIQVSGINLSESQFLKGYTFHLEVIIKY